MIKTMTTTRRVSLCSRTSLVWLDLRIPRCWPCTLLYIHTHTALWIGQCVDKAHQQLRIPFSFLIGNALLEDDKVFHLVRPADELDDVKSKRGSIKDKSMTKAITEIYLTRLLSVKVGSAYPYYHKQINKQTNSGSYTSTLRTWLL